MGLGVGTSVYAVYTDHLGSPQVVADASGNHVWEAAYDPFGEVSLLVNTIYNYFRDYDPATGRYIESDPIGLSGGLNTYAYVSGRPLGGADPYGLFDIADPSTWPRLPQGFAECIERRCWDWRRMGPQGAATPTIGGNVGTAGNLLNSTANAAAGSTGSGIASSSHATTWQHRAGSVAGQAAQRAMDGQRFGPTQAAWSQAGKVAGRLAIVPAIWEGYWDLGSIAYCSCSDQ